MDDHNPPRTAVLSADATCDACGVRGRGLILSSLGMGGSRSVIAICQGCLEESDRARIAAVPGRSARFWFESSQALARLKHRLRPHVMAIEERDAIEDGIAACLMKAKEGTK